MAKLENAGPRSGSQRSAALTSPSAATWTRSSLGGSTRSYGTRAGLVVYVALAVVLIIAPVPVGKMHAFPALMIGALGMGLASGLDVSKLVTSFETGAGAVLGSVGLIVGLGTMLGKLLAESGGADRIARTVVEIVFMPRVSLRWSETRVRAISGLRSLVPARGAQPGP